MQLLLPAARPVAFAIPFGVSRLSSAPRHGKAARSASQLSAQTWCHVMACWCWRLHGCRLATEDVQWLVCGLLAATSQTHSQSDDTSRTGAVNDRAGRCSARCLASRKRALMKWRRQSIGSHCFVLPVFLRFTTSLPNDQPCICNKNPPSIQDKT
jgi:hypothetical protein